MCLGRSLGKAKPRGGRGLALASHASLRRTEGHGGDGAPCRVRQASGDPDSGFCPVGLSGTALRDSAWLWHQPGERRPPACHGLSEERWVVSDALQVGFLVPQKVPLLRKEPDPPPWGSSWILRMEVGLPQPPGKEGSSLASEKWAGNAEEAATRPGGSQLSPGARSPPPEP